VRASGLDGWGGGRHALANSVLAILSLILPFRHRCRGVARRLSRDLGQGGFGVVGDATSNAIRFGETSQFDVCFDNVNVPCSISGGTSSTGATRIAAVSRFA